MTPWDGDIACLASEWLALGAARHAATEVQWTSDFTRLDKEQRELDNAGRWISGPTDPMAVLNVTGDELSHSDVLAWLLSPARRHGFGDALIRLLADRLWPELPLDAGPIIVEREVPDRVGIGTRADLLVWVGQALVVIENKVFSPEGPSQCEKLFGSWRSSADDVGFVLLSRSGASPVSVASQGARDAWRSLSYRDVLAILDGLTLTEGPRDELAASTVRQYSATVRRHLT